jgi:hypothetical protein
MRGHRELNSLPGEPVSPDANLMLDVLEGPRAGSTARGFLLAAGAD